MATSILAFVCGICFVVFFVVTFAGMSFLIISSSWRQSKGVGIKNSLTDVERMVETKVLEAVDLNELMFLGLPTQDIKRYSNSINKTLITEINGKQVIYASSNKDTYGTSPIVNATAAGYIGNNKFKIIVNAITTEFHFNEELIGYEAKTYSIYSYGYSKVFRRFFTNNRGEKIITYESGSEENLENNSTVTLLSNTTSRSKDLDTSIVPEINKEVKVSGIGVTDFFDANGEKIATTWFKNNSQNPFGFGFEIQFTDKCNLECKRILILHYIKMNFLI